MFYEKLAEKKQERKSQQTSRLDDIGFNVGAGMLAHKGLEKALDASAFSRLNQGGRDMVGSLRSNILYGEGGFEHMSREDAVKLHKDLVKERMGAIADEDSYTATHNPLTRIVDKISGAEDLAVKRKAKLDESDDLWRQFREGGDASQDLHDLSHETSEAGHALTGKMRKRRLLGRRVAHGIGLGATLLGANKLRNMYNNRNQEKKTAAFVKMLSED